MRRVIKTTSTSRKTAKGNDIILREKKTTRLIFKPELIDNPHDKKHSIKGTFIFQKKKPSGNWENYRKLPLSKLKDAEWVKLELHSKELYTLITHLEDYYEIFEKFGIVAGERQYLVTPANIGPTIQQLLQEEANLNKLIKQGGATLLPELLNWLSRMDDMHAVLDKLMKLDLDNIRKLNAIIGISVFKNILTVWENNKNIRGEDFWQELLKNNSWLIAQIMAVPVIIFKDKAYVGGKSIENKGGKVVDFIYKNNLTNNAILVEIKTPVTKLMSSKYRDNIYSISNDLSGSVGQILNYKDELLKNFNSLIRETDRKIHVFNPRCIVIIGSLESERLNSDQRKSFELFRNDLRNIEIVTFDELFNKAKGLLDALENVSIENWN